jgi:hypothetical protein
LFPAASVIIHVTVVFPRGKMFGASFEIEAIEQLSNVTGNPKATLYAEQPLLVFTVNAIGAVIVGFVLSITVTVCVAVFTFPLLP